MDNYKMSEYFENDKTSDNHLIYAVTLMLWWWWDIWHFDSQLSTNPPHRWIPLKSKWKF